MSEKFNSSKQEKIDSKHRAGAKQLNEIKSSNFLPSVFNTPINQKWLDATFDQMISKGDLDDFDGWIGSRHGSDIDYNKNKVYLETSQDNEIRNNVQLSPAIVSKDSFDNISTSISFDDVIKNIRLNFDEYNVNSAYQSQRSIYMPPISIKKFSEYLSYYWTPDVLIYETTDVIDLSKQGNLSYKVEDFYVENGMAIKDASGITYIVAGVGTGIRFIQYMDATDTQTYRDTSNIVTNTPGLSFDDDPTVTHFNQLEKDYIVISRADIEDTAWTRSNHWIEESTLRKIIDLVESDQGVRNELYRKYINPTRQALRPIIEFNANIQKVDTQIKEKFNQAPLFVLYDTEGNLLSDSTLYPNNTYKHNKIFSYKQGNGVVDKEIGMALSYSDTGYSSDIVFENNLLDLKVTYSVLDINGRSTGEIKTIPGPYQFLQDGILKSVYVPITALSGAQTCKQVIAESSDELSINVSATSWEVPSKFIIREYGNSFTIDTEMTSGAMSIPNIERPCIIMKTGFEYYIVDTLVDHDIYVWDEDLNEVDLFEAPAGLYKLGYDQNLTSDVIIVEDDSSFYHTVYVNGNKLEYKSENYYIDGDSIIINAGILSAGDIVDIEYVQSNNTSIDDIDVHVPDVINDNSTNQIVSDITLNNTLHHWQSIKDSFDTTILESLGITDSYRILSPSSKTGKIYVNTDIATEHDISYADRAINVSAALMEQASDWQRFKNRFISQAQREFKTNMLAYTGPADLMTKVLDAYILTRQGTALYRDSGMLDQYPDYIPQSLARFGLAKLISPYYDILENAIVCHDGSVHPLGSTSIAVDFVDPTFNAPAAALLHLETAIYEKLSQTVQVGTNMMLFLDNPHYKTWYSNAVIDNYIEKHYREYYANIEMPVADEFNKNYSILTEKSTNTGYEIFSRIDKLPGAWEGAYNVIFGTHIPHIEPWAMLGFNAMPSNWETVYPVYSTWNDSTKRANLIRALKTGVISGNSMPYASRYGWDWDNLFPVDTSGQLVRPDEILDPANVMTVFDWETPFVYGDWAGVELFWRSSSVGQAAMLDAIVKLNPTIAWTAFGNGIKEIQKNYVLRNNIDTNVDDLYKNVTTALSQKIGGFTSKHLLDVTAESSRTGMYRVESEDYQLSMYRSAPTELITASQIIVTKVALSGEQDGWRVDGISPNKQEFRFFPPINNLETDYETVRLNDTGATIKRYKRYATVEQVAEFGTIFKKAQDVYNFIIGYRKWLEYKGIQVEMATNVVANGFAIFALTAKEGEKFVAAIGSSMTYDISRGTVVEISTMPLRANSIIDSKGKVFETGKLNINRGIDQISIDSVENEQIGSATIAIVEYEHIMLFNDRTTFGNILFDKSLNLRQRRLRLHGQRTMNWTGEKSAPGFLVFEDKIVENFDSSVESVNDYYDINTHKFNKGVELAQRAANSNLHREWSENLGFDTATISKFHGGILRDKGTKGIVKQIQRLDNINVGNVDIKVTEEWMLLQSFFGDTTSKNSIEYEIRNTELTSMNQGIYFKEIGDATVDSPNIFTISPNDVLDGHKRVVNYAKVDFGVSDYDILNIEAPTAGELIDGEADLTAFGMIDVVDVFDSEADYANIDTWNETTSYNRGDLVRYNGNLWKCIQDFTGLEVVTGGIDITGTARNATFPADSTATINGTVITFGKTSTSYLDITVESSSEITPFDSYDGATIVLDNNVVDLSNLDNVLLINAYPTVLGTVTNPSIFDRRDQTLIITTSDGSTEVTETVDFTDASAPESIENNTANSTFVSNSVPDDQTITGVAAQDSYTLTVDFDTITEVTIDGTPETDYDVVGSTITFNTFVFAGGEEIIVAGTVTVVTEIKQVNFTVSQLLGAVSGYTYVVEKVTVNNVTAGYTLSGQTVTLNTAANDGASVKIFVRGIKSATLTDIVDIINDRVTTAGLVALVDSGKVRITYNIPNNTKVDAYLRIEHNGTTNDDIGFSTNSASETSSTAVPFVFFGHTKIDAISAAAAINSADISGITATSLNDKLIITRTNNTASNNSLIVSGTVLNELNIVGGTYVASTASVDVATTAIEAVEILNDGLAGSTVTFSLVDGSIRVTTSEPYIDMGDVSNLFNTIAGLPYGVQENINTTVTNVAPPVAVDTWVESNDIDNALFSVWVTDDSALEYETIDNKQVQYDSWNLFQVMNLGWYTYDEENGAETCSICAGTATVDGNDAQVTISTAHNLQVGDLVMLLNTTTTPNIDGIHTVTKVSPTDDRVFYIDRYIEKCGVAVQVMPLRPVRFNTISDRDLLTASNYYNFKDGMLAFTNYDTATTRSANVWKYGNGTWERIRYNNYRHNSNELSNIRIYDAVNRQTSVELEVFDPLRGIIPGLAAREITMRSPIDMAVYTNSTSVDYEPATAEHAWGDEQVGQVWWDTSTVKYYDYDQSDIGYRTKMWGQQFPGSSIDIYEWTKSSISPDQWESSIGSAVLGDIVSGEVYKVFNPINVEFDYFYVEQTEWNGSLGKYETVYYFWVKNKQTNIIPSRNLTVKQIASIVSNPSAAGINWCAVTGSNSIIIANVSAFINAENSVLQINMRPANAQHNNWTAIREDADLIPDFWYHTVRSNLVGHLAKELDSGEIELIERLPNIYLNKFNRYGNDIEIGQGWFEDLWSARREALDVANTLLSDMNVYHELPGSWWRTITSQTVREVWNWITYVHPQRNPVRMPSVILSAHSQMFDDTRPDFIDTSKHQVVLYRIPESVTTIELEGEVGNQVYSFDISADEIMSLTIDGVTYEETKDWEWIDHKTINIFEYQPEQDITGLEQYGISYAQPEHGYTFTGGEVISLEIKNLDRSEIFEYVNGEWILTEKKNSTIRFNDLLWRGAMANAWDMQGWDTNAWDNTYAEAQYYVIKALREDLFIGNFIERFNKWFLGTIQYVLSEHDQVDWVYKTTYVSVDVETFTDSTMRRFARNDVDEITAFVSEVKPFHTKIRTTYDINKATDNISINLETTCLMDTEIDFGGEYSGVYVGEFGDMTITDEFVLDSTDSYFGGSFTDSVVDVLDGSDFLDPSSYNRTRRTEAYLVPSETLSMSIMTNASGNVVDSNTRTMIYLHDKYGIKSAYALSQVNSTTITADVAIGDLEIEIQDTSEFSSTGGYAMYNGSIIRYAQAITLDPVLSTGKLYGITYCIDGVYAQPANAGDLIVDVTNSKLTFTESNYMQLNDSGSSILTSGTNILPRELSTHGYGVHL